MIKTIKNIREKLSQIYFSEELESITRLILEDVTGYNRLQLHLRRSELLSEPKIMQIEKIVNRLLTHEPIQYILGKTEFFGLPFKVTPDVLIPRPETEELVDWIIREEKKSCQSLLDIGTGSGCIPIAIDKNANIKNIEGWDISEEALKIARFNAAMNHSGVIFSNQDILDSAGISSSQKWDVIVSNPPYVLRKESAAMGRNVLDFEPHLALFVPNKDPLVFYRAIAHFASLHLNPNGNIYFEINENQGDQTAELLGGYGFTNILTRKDLQGKERMIRAKRI